MSIECCRSRGLTDLLSTDPAYGNRYEALLLDVSALEYASLKSKYLSEFQSWKNRKHWCKKCKQPWDQRMNSFADFLKSNGPIPNKHWTLDRIDPKGFYKLDNLRWASKATQSQNRTCARTIPVDGIAVTINEAAQALGKTADAVRMSMNRHGVGYVAEQLRQACPPHKINRDDPENLWAFPRLYKQHLEEQYATRGQQYSNRHVFFIALLDEELDEGRSAIANGSIRAKENWDSLLRELRRLSRFADRQLTILRYRAFVHAEAELKQRAAERGEIYQAYSEECWLPYRGPWEMPKECFSGGT